MAIINGRLEWQLIPCIADIPLDNQFCWLRTDVNGGQWFKQLNDKHICRS